MKTLYTEKRVEDTGTQIVIRAVDVNNKMMTEERRSFESSFPEVASILGQMFTSIVDENLPEQEPLKLGDVIWVQNSANRYVANCIVFDEKFSLSTDAVRAAAKNIDQKAKSLSQITIASGLFAASPMDGEDPVQARRRWNDVYKILEDEIEPQLVVCFPTHAELVDVLTNLPDAKRFNKIFHKPYIRFRNLQENDK